MKTQRPTVVIHTDGSCDPYGNGGWSATLRYGDEMTHISGFFPETTNNRMEMYAVIAALGKLTVPCDVLLYSDSRYVLDGLSNWLKNWSRNLWRTSSGSEVKNADLWKMLETLTSYHNVKGHWVKGHNGNIDNEICDSLAQHTRMLFSFQSR